MVTEFKPHEGNTRILRDAFSKFVSGVTVVTTASEEGPVGITANSFSSLSLDPALVLWSPYTGSRRFPFFENAQYFAIHILSVDQEYLCHDFAKSPFGFDNTEVSYNTENVPLIENCLARFECRKRAIYPGGDHVIVVGEVESVQMREDNALSFFDGKFRELSI
mgnify:CR=1 FL=1